MKEQVPFTQLIDHEGGTVTIHGFVDAIRNLKHIQFLVLRNRTGSIQITHDPIKGHSRLTNAINGLRPESSVTVRGRVQKNEHVKLHGLEIIPEEIILESAAEQPIPLQENASQSDRMDWRFLDLRKSDHLLIFQVQTLVEQAMREFFIQNEFLEIHSPKLMGTPSESGAEVFEVKYFDHKAYLAQSPQFYKQMAMAAGFDRVFEIGPVFRADSSHTIRHATEFIGVDMEISWIDSHEDIMAMEEKWLIHVLKSTADLCGHLIEKAFHKKITIPSSPFPKITLSDAIDLLKRHGHGALNGNGDLDLEGEKLLSELLKKKYGHEFVFITDYPISIRPFYHMRMENDQSKTKSYDLLWNGTEITTGAQREHRYDILISQAKEKNMSLPSLQFYLDFFRYGVPPHGGFGFGLSRFLMILLNQPNIRETTFLHRSPERLLP